VSNNCVLVYVLRHSGVRGCLTSGKIEFDEGKGLRVYNAFGTLNEYILGVRDEELERFQRRISHSRVELSHARGRPTTGKGTAGDLHTGFFTGTAQGNHSPIVGPLTCWALVADLFAARRVLPKWVPGGNH